MRFPFLVSAFFIIVTWGFSTKVVTSIQKKKYQNCNPKNHYLCSTILIMQKGTKKYAILNFKCARCHEGDLFPTKIREMHRFFEMNKRCSFCNLNFTPEPGFYYGSMFISYIMTGTIFLAISGIFILVFKISVNHTLATLFFLLILFFVYIFRISRSIWINMMIRYNKEKVAEIASKQTKSAS